MAQDTALLRYLLKWARRAPWSWSQRDLAFAFDWTNDFISSNATIGRTGYDMNVSGNVSTGSDADGSYIQFNGNRDDWLLIWTRAEVIWWSTPLFTQATSFTISSRFKVPTLPTGVTGIFWSNQDACIDVNATQIRFTVRWSTTVTNWYSLSANTLYTCHLVYDSATAKFYCYINWTLQNAWWTAWPATFSTDTRRLSDNAIWWWTQISCNKYIYHAAIRNKALTQAEIDADIALWNTTKNDPSIVAYYIPDNLTYNTQYWLNPKALDQSNWIKTWATTVTADTTVAPDGTTTADTVNISGTASQWCTTVVTSISWSTIASKTFIVKAFVKVAAGTSLFRLECSHNGIATYNSSDLTATTTRQEFTFTQAFTSATWWTGITYGIDNSSWATNPSLQVRNVRLFLVNETLRDESPNIWWFIWWKTQKVLSCRVKPNIDWVATSSSQPLLRAPRFVSYVANSANNPVTRYDNRFWWQLTTWTSLWSWFRWKVHYSFVYYRNSINWTWAMSIYKNGILDITQNKQQIPPTAIGDTTFIIWKHPSPTYFSWNIRDARIYTFTWSFTNADALAIYNGGEPTSSWITKYLHYRPPVGEVGTTTQDQSTNDRDWTLNNWVTRDYI